MEGIIFNFSPSLKGSSAFISKRISEVLLSENVSTEVVNIHKLKILPCGSCSEYCYKYGKCKIKNDDMSKIYKMLTTKDFFVIVTPVYFYHIPGYAKIMIDRCQPYWVRKYILKNFVSVQKLGSLVCVAATKGKKLFSGINLTTKYFFDIFNINFNKKFNLYLRNVETIKDINNNKTELDQYICSLSISVKKYVLLKVEKGRITRYG